MAVTMNDGVVPAPARFLFERLFTSSALVVAKVPPPGDVDFIRLRLSGGPDLRQAMHACLRLEPWSEPVGPANGRCFLARSLRCSLRSSPQDRLPAVVMGLFRCASCGWSAWYQEGDAQCVLGMVCPACKIGPSICKCSMHHTFGRCDVCTDEAIDECPFGDDPQGQAAAVASHVPLG